VPRMPTKNSNDERQSAAEFIVLLLSERLRRKAHGPYTTANERHIRRLCSALLWQHSEAAGKYKGCQHWSVAAIESFRKHNRIVTSKRDYRDEALIHEHLFPRSQLLNLLFKLSEPTVADVRALLDRLNIGVVITAGEDKLLSKKGVESDPWERYRKAGIEYTSFRPLSNPTENDSLTSDLLESNAEFQALVAKSRESPRKPFKP
jgi:hypothetical protein